MTRKPLLLPGLFLCALVLAACGATTSGSWPGLAANSDLAFVVLNQQLHAINLSDGKQAWAFPASATANTGLFYAEPAITPEIIVLGSEGPTNSHSGILFGIDPTTHQQRWCLAFDKKGAQRQNCPQAPNTDVTGLFGIALPNDNRFIGGIVVTEGVAYFGLANSTIYAVDTTSGSVKWSFKAENAVWSTPFVTSHALYVTSLAHLLYALDRETGRLLWQKDLGAAIAGGATAADGKVYVGTFGSKFYALSAETGDEIWSQATNNWVWTTPVVHAGLVYFGDLAGTLFALDANTGDQKWAVTPGGRLRASPAIAGDTLYIGDEKGKFFALDLASGAQRWSQEMKGELLTSPIVVGDLVLIAPYKGDNLLVGYTTTGALKWAFAPSK